MKNFKRDNLLFSLCGLNCGLCPMKIDGYCPGCGGGAGNQSCKIARCSMEHGGIEYCFQCGKYPCEKYEGIDEFDSFITHQKRRTDFERAEEAGIDFYNDGRRKSFYCTAVNLLDLDDVRAVMASIHDGLKPDESTLKERAAAAVKIFREKAGERQIVLKLKKKPRKKK